MEFPPIIFSNWLLGFFENTYLYTLLYSATFLIALISSSNFSVHFLGYLITSHLQIMIFGSSSSIFITPISCSSPPPLTELPEQCEIAVVIGATFTGVQPVLSERSYTQKGPTISFNAPLPRS